MFFTAIIVRVAQEIRVALHHFLAVQSPIQMWFLKSLYRVSSSPPSPCHYSRLSLQHHKLKVCACAVLGSELRVSTRNEKTVLEKRNTFLRNYKREISIHSIKHTVDMHTHINIYAGGFLFQPAQGLQFLGSSTPAFSVFLPSLFTLFCLVETLIIFLGILMSPLSSNTTEIICPGTRYIRHRGTHH